MKINKEGVINASIFTGLIVLLFLIVSYFLQSCTPVRYVYVDPKDSVVRQQRIIQNDVYLHMPMYFGTPYYRPTIIYSAPIRIPQRPTYRGRGRH